ncbi:MAG TPA: hypothetical protein VGH91_07390 [Gammaproteobacteria bacterium]|jgi:hypothetical protein
MNRLLSAGACALAIACAAPASAKPWVDYVPQKGFWEYTYVKVDVNHIDDYLTQMKRIWVPGREIDKKHGLIDQYQVMTNIMGAAGDANVMLCVHYVSFAGLDPDKARDMAIFDENTAAVTQAASADFNKYRTIVGSSIYVPVDYTK